GDLRPGGGRETPSVGGLAATLARRSGAAGRAADQAMNDVLEQGTHANAQRNGHATATVRDAQRAATERFRAVESETPRLDADLLGSVDWEVDAVVANLPYIDPDELPDLYPELRAEPRTATLAEEHGLALIRRLVSQAVGVPALVLEVGREQAAAVREIVKGGG